MSRNITVTFTDGTSHVYQNAPDSLTPQMVTARAQKDFGKPVSALDGGRKAAPAPKAPQNAPAKAWGDVPMEALGNLIPSAANFLGGMYQTVRHPIDTAEAGLNALAGGARNAAEAVLPKEAFAFLKSFESDPAAIQKAVQTANAVGGVYRQRYGSMEGLKNTLATDPIGAAADISTILSAGAGAIKGASPRAAERAAEIADRINPGNAVTSVAKVAGKAGTNAARGVYNALAPKSAAYMEAAEGRGAQIVNALRDPARVIVPGTKPTAAEAATASGSTRFSALGSSAEKVTPTAYRERRLANDAARVKSLQEVGGTEGTLQIAENARDNAAGLNYARAFKAEAKADPTLMQLADDPYFKAALPDAVTLSKSQGVTFKENPIQFLHNVKISLGKALSRNGDTALANTEKRQVQSVSKRLVKWIEDKAPAYGQARGQFAADSVPINQMQVGQFLEGKLVSAQGEAAPQQFAAYAQAVRDAPGTLKRSLTGEQRFQKLDQVLTPEQVRIVKDIRADLERSKTNQQMAGEARSIGPRADKMVTDSEAPARIPNLLNRVAAVANTIMKRLQGQLDRKMAIQIATEMLDPDAAADALQKAMNRSAKGDRAEFRAKMAGRQAEKVGRSPPITAGAQVNNAMATSNQNAMRRER